MQDQKRCVGFAGRRETADVLWKGTKFPPPKSVPAWPCVHNEPTSQQAKERAHHIATAVSKSPQTTPSAPRRQTTKTKKWHVLLHSLCAASAAWCVCCEWLVAMWKSIMACRCSFAHFTNCARSHEMHGQLHCVGCVFVVHSSWQHLRGHIKEQDEHGTMCG